MRRLILGTAGHIDHGKTALVRALTGVDTDRLKEEKERGITVDLGFAEYRPREDVLFGVVDVPGHEGFIRNMLAGATGMDLVLLVVAADEGVMPQTREHLSIVRLLAVPRLAVALTKTDLVEDEWAELVQEEVLELLEGTPYRDAPLVPVSVVSGEGMDELGQMLADLGAEAEEKGSEDAPRLPIDRVFTIKGAGTVVTGTLWSGRLEEGSRVSVLPGDHEGRIRSLQLHGEEVRTAGAGARVAVGITGSRVGHQDLHRGQTVVEGEGWEVSWMLTCRVSLLTDTGWELEQGQRVRVHLGTSEALARVALLEGDRLGSGQEGWVQLRLEEPLLARVRDHLVLRSYSPVTTMGGGRVAEVFPKKRRHLEPGEPRFLEGRLGDAPADAVRALAEMVGWTGATLPSLPQRTGFPPGEIQDTLGALLKECALVQVEDRIFSRAIWKEGKERVLHTLEVFHENHPLKPGPPLEELRQVLPGGFGPKLAEAVLQHLAGEGRVALRGGNGALADFRPSLSERQRSIRDRLLDTLTRAGLAPPNIRELADELGAEEEVGQILRLMEADGEVIALDSEFFFEAKAVREAARSVVARLGGEPDLGPADFRDVVPVTRKHLLPLLRYFDLVGVTIRLGDGRDVARELPTGWETSS